MKFGILDVSVFRRICHEMRIDTSFIAKELPALVLFENGKEKARMINRNPGLFPGPGIRSVVSPLACCSLHGVLAGALLQCGILHALHVTKITVAVALPRLQESSAATGTPIPTGISSGASSMHVACALPYADPLSHAAAAWLPAEGRRQGLPAGAAQQGPEG